MSKKKKTAVCGSQEPGAGSREKQKDDGSAAGSPPATGYRLPATNDETTITLESGGKSVTVSEKTFKEATGRFLGLSGGCRAEGETPNIIAPGAPPTETGSELVGVARVELRAMAQRCIDHVREHRHLQDARVLLLVIEKPSTAKNLEAGKRVSIGKAAKARSLDRLLSSVKIAAEPDGDGVEREKHEHADFVVRLSGDWLSAIGWPLEPGSDKLALALIDHEPCHCGAKIAGEFVKPAELAARVEELGDDHVETCEDVKRDGDVLVRYYSRTEAGSYRWVVRKHDVEEFQGVIERHGAWDRQLRRMVDVLVEREDLPLLRAAAKGDEEAA